MRYKEFLSTITSQHIEIKDLIEFYGRSGELFLIREKTDTYYDLIFNRQFNSPVTIPFYTKEQILLAPYFYLDDDNVFLNIYQLQLLVLFDRFEHLKGDEKKYKFKHYRLLKKDITSLNNYISYVSMFTVNNTIKMYNRVRVIKTYKIDSKAQEKVYCKTFGESIWDHNIPTNYEDIIKYSKLFNDPISVVQLTKGVYKLSNIPYRAAGYFSDSEKIISIFPMKSNIPERLRQHYSSNYLQPKHPDQDYLFQECANEKISAMCVFLPIQSKWTSNTTDNDTPLGENTLLTGEAIINERMAHKELYVRRTFQTTSLDVDIAKVGQILQPGDCISYNSEGNEDLVYNLKYKNAEIESIIKLHGGYKIVLKIVCPLGVSRIISDYGIKGVTHPRKDLGYIIPNEKFGIGNNKYNVEMILGPNSIKGKGQSIKLSWLNWMQKEKNTAINFTPEFIINDDIKEYFKNFDKVKWFYKGKEYIVYAGLVSFGVTESAIDCRSDNVRIMPETLKYMYLSENKHMEKCADLLLQKYTRTENKWVLQELMNLTESEIFESLPVFEWDSPTLHKLINASPLQISHWVDANSSAMSHVLLNSFNKGFYVKLKDTIVKFPSARLIRYLSQIYNSILSFPDFVVPAMLILYALKLKKTGKATDSDVQTNVTKYLKSVNEMIYNKKAALPSAISPSVEGGNLKQLVSTYVPRGITVVLDFQLEKKIQSFKKKNNLDTIIEIGVRNPVLWRFQLCPRKVWTSIEFKSYLNERFIDINDVIIPMAFQGSVLRNITDTMHDKADTDGDLYPIAIPMNMEIQKELNMFYKNYAIVLSEHEDKWIQLYCKDEANKFDFNSLSKPFEFYTISREDMSTFLSNSAIAKMDVGIATVDLWKFHGNVEELYSIKEIDYEQMLFLQFIYAALVQDLVVQGIKHNESGSSDYVIFQDYENNEKTIIEYLSVRYGLNEEETQLFINALKTTDANSPVSTLCRLIGGGYAGKLAKKIDNIKELSEIQIQNMSYGKILKPIWSIIQKHVYKTQNMIDEDLDYSSVLL